MKSEHEKNTKRYTEIAHRSAHRWQRQMAPLLHYRRLGHHAPNGSLLSLPRTQTNSKHPQCVPSRLTANCLTHRLQFFPAEQWLSSCCPSLCLVPQGPPASPPGACIVDVFTLDEGKKRRRRKPIGCSVYDHRFISSCSNGGNQLQYLYTSV